MARPRARAVLVTGLLAALVGCLPVVVPRASAAPAPPPGPAPGPAPKSGVSSGLGAQLELAAAPNTGPEVRAAQAAVDRLTAGLAAAEQRFLTARAELAQVREQLRQAEQQVVVASRAVAVARLALGHYVAALYRLGRTPNQAIYWSLLADGAGDDALHLASMAGMIAGSQSDELTTLLGAERRLDAARDAVRATEQRQAALVAASQDQRSTVRAHLDSARQQLAVAKGAAGFSIFSQSGAGLLPQVSVAVRQAAVARLVARRTPDVWVSGLPDATTADRVAALAPGSVVVRTGTLVVSGHRLPALAADPGRLRALTPAGTAEDDRLWRALAGGNLVLSHVREEELSLTLGLPVPLVVPQPPGSRASLSPPPPPVRLGGIATTGLPGADLLVPPSRARALGLEGWAVLLSAPAPGDPNVLLARAAVAAGARARAERVVAGPGGVAFLSGGAAAARFGVFSYRYFPDGTIAPDAAWQQANIRTETVPLLGRVTCHRLIFTQLRGALADVSAAGLAGAIHPGEYGGCFVPRFIARDPARGMSLHTWGIAIDLNVPGNQRGTAGQIDRRVVAIFKKWGFRWGGDWSYTDPMHFELGALLSQ